MVLSAISGGALAGRTAYSSEFSRDVVSRGGGRSFGAMMACLMDGITTSKIECEAC